MFHPPQSVYENHADSFPYGLPRTPPLYLYTSPVQYRNYGTQKDAPSCQASFSIQKQPGYHFPPLRHQYRWKDAPERDHVHNHLPHNTPDATNPLHQKSYGIYLCLIFAPVRHWINFSLFFLFGVQSYCKLCKIQNNYLAIS